MIPTGWVDRERDADRSDRRIGAVLATAVIAAAIAGVFVVGAASADDVAFVSVTTSPERPTVYDEVTVEVTVTNPATNDQNYVLDRLAIRETRASDSESLVERDTSQTIRPGMTGTVSAEIDLEESGTRTVYAHLRIVSGGGGPISVVRPVTIDVLDPHPGVSLRASPIDAANRTRLSINVVNGGQSAIQGLTLKTDAENVRIQEPRRVAGRLAAGETRTFHFTGVEASPGPATVAVTMDYVTADGTHRSTTATLQTVLKPRQNPARIALTNTRITREDGALVVRGEVSNVGGSNASDVLVSVGSSDEVGPAQDQATFFVGSIQASEYKTFTVHAALENATGSVTVPIRVEYTVDGVARTRTIDLGYTTDSADAVGSSRQGDAGSALAVVGVLAVLVVAIVVLYGVYRYRSRDDGDA